MSRKKSPAVLVEQRIAELEISYRDRVVHVKNSLADLGKRLRPSHLLTTGIKNTIGSKRLPAKMLLSTLGLGAGVVLKKVLLSKSTNVVRRIAGFGLQFLITRIVAKRSRRKNFRE